MKNLPNIDLNPTEFWKNYYRNLFNFGSESVILKSEDKKALYKVFLEREGRTVTGMSENKFEKIKKLYELNPLNCTVPISSVTLGGTLIGYAMVNDSDYNAFAPKVMSRKDRIHVLEQTKDILEKFKEYGIIYGDLKENNILVNHSNLQVKLCDMDNTYVDGLDMDLEVIILHEFIKRYGKLDYNVHPYMHNLLTLSTMFFPHPDASYKTIIETLQKGLNPRGFDASAETIFEEMCCPQEFTGKYLIKKINNRHEINNLSKKNYK